jgi:hypothetical protein
MRREEGGVRRANAGFFIAAERCTKQFCKRFYNFKFERVELNRINPEEIRAFDFLGIAESVLRQMGRTT